MLLLRVKLFSIIRTRTNERNAKVLRPTMYESFEDCRDFHFDFIHTCQDLIQTIQTIIKNHPERDHTLAREVIKQEQDIIKTIYAELKEMQRWWLREGKKDGKRKQLLEKTSST